MALKALSRCFSKPSLHTYVRYIRQGKRGPINADFGEQKYGIEDADYSHDSDRNEDVFMEFFNTPREENFRKPEERERHFIKQKILKRKYDKKPKRLNILTWAAKSQIRYLNEMDPNHWSVDQLAESFPVSRDEIISILKAPSWIRSAEEIVRHDAKVHRNWKLIKTNLDVDAGPLNPEVANMIMVSKLALMKNAGGIEGVPMPHQSFKKPVAVTEPRKVRLFESIIVDYREMLQKKEEERQQQSDSVELKSDDVNGVSPIKASPVSEKPETLSDNPSEDTFKLLQKLSEYGMSKDDGNSSVESVEDENVLVSPLVGEVKASCHVSSRRARRLQRKLKAAGLTSTQENEAGNEGLEVNSSNIDVLKMLETQKIPREATTEDNSHMPVEFASPDLNSFTEKEQSNILSEARQETLKSHSCKSYDNVRSTRTLRPRRSGLKANVALKDLDDIEPYLDEGSESNNRYSRAQRKAFLSRKFDGKEKEVYDEDGELLYRVE